MQQTSKFRTDSKIVTERHIIHKQFTTELWENAGEWVEYHSSHCSRTTLAHTTRTLVSKITSRPTLPYKPKGCLASLLCTPIELITLGTSDTCKCLCLMNSCLEIRTSATYESPKCQWAEASMCAASSSRTKARDPGRKFSRNRWSL
jgi:hypothetical protein